MELYQSEPFYITYNAQQYNFRNCIEKLMGTSNLEELHQLQQYEVLDRAHDQSTVWHKKYYEQFDAFNTLYVDFVKNYLKPLFF